MEPPAVWHGTGVTRVRVLSFPAPSTGHYLAFILALLTAGSFVGNWLHNEVVGEAWTQAVLACEVNVPAAEAAGGDIAIFTRVDAVQRCQYPAELVRVMWSLAGAAAVGIAALALVFVRPVFVRRRRHLTEPTPAMAASLQRVALLSREAGLGQPPRVLVGPSGMRDPFCFGAPGRYTVAMPRKLIALLQRPGVHDALLRHELAHIRHHDVALAWLARSVWYVAGPLLLLPVAWALVSGDGSLLPTYLWRAVLLGLVIELTTAALLRSRELDADLAAAQRPSDLADLQSCLTGIRPSVPLPAWRAWIARHPKPTERLNVLRAPEIAAALRWTDAAAPAFLVAMAVPLAVTIVTTFTAGLGQGLFSFVVGALLLGPVLAFTVGFAIWRAELMRNASAPPRKAKDMRWVAVAGVGLGLTAGQLASLAQTGIDVTGLEAGPSIFIPALLGMGATGLVAGLSEIYGLVARLARTAAVAWVTGLVATTVLFTVSAWVWVSLQFGLEKVGWEGTRLWLVTALAWPPLLWSVALLVLAAVVSLFLAPTAGWRALPGWLGGAHDWPAAQRVDTPAPFTPGLIQTLVVGTLVGCLTTAAIVVWRVTSGPANTDAEKEVLFYSILWITAGSWAAVNVAAALVQPARGGALSLVAGPLAVLVSVLGFAVLNTVRGGDFSLSFIALMLWPALGLGFVLTLATSVLFARPTRPGGMTRSGWSARTGDGAAKALVPAVSGALAVCFAAGAIAAAPALVSAPATPNMSTGQLNNDQGQLYALGIAQEFLADYESMDNQLKAAGQVVGSDPAVFSRYMRSVTIPAVSGLRTKAEAYKPPTETVQAVHAHFVEAMQLCEEKALLFLQAVELNDPARFEEALVRQTAERSELNAWIRGVVELQVSTDS
ncbi:M48 family metalloprotease [Paenarthrobacter sp. NPDC056912]|uniref:M48 family metalloprotease n=1 Tax=Paenarthrobacter sp. NPDC056912 TaxID=3345965 RepID=UPI003672FCB0